MIPATELVFLEFDFTDGNIAEIIANAVPPADRIHLVVEKNGRRQVLKKHGRHLMVFRRLRKNPFYATPQKRHIINCQTERHQKCLSFRVRTNVL